MKENVTLTFDVDYEGKRDVNEDVDFCIIQK